MMPARKERMLRYARLALFVLLLLPGLVTLAGAAATTDGNAQRTAAVLQINGPIGPATSDYFLSAMDKARESGADLIVVRMDTPGGLDDAMRTIIQEIVESPVPVATIVWPGGARAASAGTYILYASHIAAMAPGTNLGAATPVQVGGPGDLPGDEEAEDPENGEAGESDDNGEADNGREESGPQGDAMERKMVNDAVAYIRSLARMHGRNEQWAEQAVREAASLPAGEALEINVIDVVAQDVRALLEQIDGREVNLKGQDEPYVLETAELALVEFLPDWRHELLAVLTNPNVAYFLMLIGIYGLILEFYSPGAIVPGVVGGISLLLALYAFNALPVNYAGAALILLGILLMVAEMLAPSFGALGLGGAIAFIVGSVILIDTDAPGFGVSPELIAAVGLVTVVLFLALIAALAKARGRDVVSGREALVGAEGTMISAARNQTVVRVMGENWSARSEYPLRKGQRVRVTERDGLTLVVQPCQDEPDEEHD